VFPVDLRSPTLAALTTGTAEISAVACWAAAADIRIGLKSSPDCVRRDALVLPRFRVSESLSSWMTIAGGGDSPFFDLERLFSRQKVTRAGQLGSCGALRQLPSKQILCGARQTRFESHEKDCNRVSPNSGWRTTNREISSPGLESRERSTVQAKTGCQDESTSRHAR
jgi:hypothetical protein